MQLEHLKIIVYEFFLVGGGGGEGEGQKCIMGNWKYKYLLLCILLPQASSWCRVHRNAKKGLVWQE